MNNEPSLTFIKASFTPPFWARNCHLQSLLGTLKFRRPALIKKSQRLLTHSQEFLLDAHDGIRLQSFYSPQQPASRKLAVLLHGWEGSHESLYLLSAANSLYQAGYDVLRLNLRDHGSSHHLNKELFHSNRLQEMVDAVKSAQEKFQPDTTYLIGFSLGGNFATRIAVEASRNQIALEKTIAICPAIEPKDILVQLENGLRFYHDYFVKKWKRSLRIKQSHFPDEYDFDEVHQIKSMREMTNRLLELFGDFKSSDHYFNGYALSGERLKDLDSSVTMLISKDDPVINFRDTFTLTQNSYLDIHISEYGGHCGFIKNSKLQSWADEFILAQLKQV
ncbi:YheT family hydrolase [Kangiella sp. HZ709]|uniref:YheT family hydrolase n=1 Tax=Kangiella sp. HZ709 TaxID=2666328 RepID=UPI0012AF031B|nr:alpha/beta fold hydrolase [Kangiella sp. HZ709]MRX27762.1 alpha/beta fold hydrolase [Kangiella sp. HZ709]